MSFIPYENLTFETSLSMDEAVVTLSKEIEPKRFFRNPFSTRYKTFEGRVEKNSFEIRRIIISNNPFLPIIKGRFEPTFEGTRVILRMTIDPFVKIILFLIFSWVAVGIIAPLLNSMTYSTFNINMSVFKVILLVSAYLAITGFFKRESVKARKILIRLFSDKEELNE